VTLYFAYGSNMSRTVMRHHAPAAEPLGVARLAHHRFVITAQGHASVTPAASRTVYGVLWRLTLRDHVTLAAWEDVGAGLYRTEILPVRHGGRRLNALVYVGRGGRTGGPLAGYMEVVIGAALEWRLPDVYIAELRRWLNAPPRRLRNFGWM
jgi:hypothetical protein